MVEGEIKLAVTPSFRLPALGDGVEGMEAVPAPPEQLSTTYFDTDDLRLARSGASLRRRTVEGWPVKLPAREELGWLAGILGAPRDRDVLLARLRRRADGLAAADARSGWQEARRALSARRGSWA